MTIAYDIYLAVLDPELDQAPGVLTVVAAEGPPELRVSFSIDGEVVAQEDLDSEGYLSATSIPVPDTVMAGTHTLSIGPTDPGEPAIGSSAEFTIAEDPDPGTYLLVPDADPVAIPEASATGVQKWVLQDLLATEGALGSYVFPFNPTAASPWPFTRELSQQAMVSLDGAFSISEPMGTVQRWSFSGYYETQEFAETLEAYSRVNRRLYLIDHRNRAWTIAIAGLDLIPRRRKVTAHNEANDWVGDYQMRVLIYGSEWKVPQ